MRIRVNNDPISAQQYTSEYVHVWWDFFRCNVLANILTMGCIMFTCCSYPLKADYSRA